MLLQDGDRAFQLFLCFLQRTRLSSQYRDTQGSGLSSGGNVSDHSNSWPGCLTAFGFGERVGILVVTLMITIVMSRSVILLEGANC